jgi:hypothetical protein
MEENDKIQSVRTVATDLAEKQERLVNWTTHELANLLKEIQMSRIASEEIEEQAWASNDFAQMFTSSNKATTPIDEVEDIITLPKFDAKAHSSICSSKESFELTEKVVSELHSYVSAIASMYHKDNPFHNFEHASHVAMSVVKLLARIVAPDIQCTDEDEASTLHDHTYGITSDPLTQFAVVFSALIHDVDHPGAFNAQLIKEKDPLATTYKNKSVAEQNSVDLAWDLLMRPDYVALRHAIYHTEAEFNRFYQLIVNAVMATDIMDKDLSTQRKGRWKKAFFNDVEEDSTTAVNRKATIVIEHLIQASDVAHTMQHWHIYRKWNGRLFGEIYKVS